MSRYEIICDMIIDAFNSRLGYSICPKIAGGYYFRLLSARRECGICIEAFFITAIISTLDSITVEYRLESQDPKCISFPTGHPWIGSTFTGYVEDPEFINDLVNSFLQYLADLKNLKYVVENINVSGD